MTNTDPVPEPIAITANALIAVHPSLTWSEALRQAREIHAKAEKQFMQMFGEER